MPFHRPSSAANATLVSAILLAGSLTSPAKADSSAARLKDIPPPTAVAIPSSQQILQLELVVNGVSTGMVVAVIQIDGRFRVARTDLVAAGLSPPATLGNDVTLNGLPGVRVDYDEPNQRLGIDVPADWLPAHSITASGIDRGQPVSSFGMLFNYDINVTSGGDGGTRGSVWGEARTFGNFGQVSLTGALLGKKVVRYDFRWSRSDDDNMLTYEGGDFITRTLSDGQPVRMAGIQISRDFSVRPDIITYPLPAFVGDARLPSTVDLYIDGYRAAAAQVAPGPFSIGGVPGLNGAGDATIAVTDMLGRRVTTTVPFYVSNDLLRAGLVDFSAAIGVMRRGYGQRSFAYGPAAATGAARYGVSSFVTVEGSAEARPGHIAGSIGALVQLGVFGVLNASYARSVDRDVSGDRLSIGYQYRTRRFSFAASRIQESAGFFDLASLGNQDGGRSITTVLANFSVGGLGNVGANYISTTDWRGAKTRLVNGTWSLPVGGALSLYMSGGYDVRQRRWSGALNFILPLGGQRGTAAASVTRDVRGGTSARFDYGRAPPSQGGLGGSATFARSSDAGFYGGGELDWRTGAFEARAGGYGQDGSVTGWAGVSGAIVLMDGGVFPANRIADSFVLVSTNGQPDVPITYDNQNVGKTDRHGHLLVPWVTAYYSARYAVDPFGLPVDMIVPVVDQRLAVARGSGAVLRFDFTAARSGRITLVDGSGAVLPVGAIASVNGGDALVVGWDGLLFVETLADINVARITLPNGGRCTASFSAPARASDVDTIGPVTCH